MVLGHQNLGRVLWMSFTLTIHFSIIESVNAIFPELTIQNGYPYVGQITLMVTYACEVYGDIYGSKYISLQRSGLSFFVCGMLPLFLYLPLLIMNNCGTSKAGICSYGAIFTISVIVYAIQGLGLGTYLLMFNIYQSACADNKSADFLNGISFTLTGFTFFIGNIFSEVLVAYMSQQNFFFVLAGTQMIVSTFFLCLPNPTPDQDKIEPSQTEQSGTHDQSSKSTQMETYKEPENEEAHHDPMKEIIERLKDPAARKLIPYFFVTGLVVGFIFGQFYQVVVDSLPDNETELKTNQKTYKNFIFFGIGEILSGPIIVMLNGKVQLSTYLITYILTVIITVVLTAINVYVKNYHFCWIIAMCWGCIDNFGQSTSNMIISQQWGQDESLFGLYLVVQNLGAIIYQVFALFFEFQYMIVGLSFIFLVSSLALFQTYLFVLKFYKGERNKE